MTLLKKITLADTVLELKKLDNCKEISTSDINKILETALNNRLILKEVSDEADLSQKLFHAASILNLSFNIEDNFTAFADELHEIIDFDNLALALIDKNNIDYDIFGAYWDEDICTYSPIEKFPIEKTAIGWVFKTKKPLIISDFSRRKFFIEDEHLLESGLRAGIRVPLMFDKEVTGVLMLCSKNPKQYSKKHIKVCKLLAAQITAVLKNSYLYSRMKYNKQQLEASQDRLKFINNLLEVLVQQRSIPTLIETAFIKIIAYSGREMGAITLLNEKKNRLELQYAYGLSDNFLRNFQTIGVGQGNTGKAAATGKTIIVSDVAKNEVVPGLHQREGMQSGCYIPLKARKNIIGVMSIGSKTQQPFTIDEIVFLESLTNYLALFIERLKMTDKLTELASIDNLSELLNRTTFYKELSLQISRAQRYSEYFSVLMLDIDHFKKYNDTFGHIAGDKLIKRIGKLIKRFVRTSDIAARYGGEEFAIIAFGTDKDEAYLQGERLRKLIMEKLKDEGITVSIGISAYPSDGIEAEMLLRRADKALYNAKNQGRNYVVRFSEIE